MLLLLFLPFYFLLIIRDEADVLSHWMLRMAFIDQRHWLLRFESLIYEIRLENLDKKEALKCIEKQIEEYYKKVGFTLRKDPSTKKFIIPFEDAPFLLESHQTTI